MTPDLSRSLRAAAGPDPNGPADGELLRRFAVGRDEAAFELLVWRHAGMVRRVCRARLRDHHAAEDAAQAVFLALARHADTVGRRGTVAGWLFRVARRIAGRAVRRRTPAVAVLADLPAPARESDPDLARVLHEELDRLPSKYREPVLLCYFEGLTQAAVARRLGWPAGTVATRITRGRVRLFRRLVGRGVTLPAAGLAGVLTADPAGGAGFVTATTTAAMTYTAGGAVPPAVLALVAWEGRVMVMAKLRWAVLMVFAGLTAGGGGVWMAGGQEPPKAAKPPEAKAKPSKPGSVEQVFPCEELNYTTTDMVYATGLDVYKFKLDMPVGQKFDIVFRELEGADDPVKELHRSNWQRRADFPRPVTVCIGLVREDGTLANVLKSPGRRAVLRLSIDGCVLSGNQGPIDLPKLAGIPLPFRRVQRHLNDLNPIRLPDPGPGVVRLISIDSLEFSDQKHEPFPRAEWVIERK